MVGPVLGSLIYSIVNYEYIFFVFAAILLICVFTVFFLLPNRLNKTALPADDESIKSAPPVQISFVHFFTNMRAMLAIIAAMVAMIFMLFFNSILSIELENNHGVNPNDVGYIFSLGAFAYALSSPVVSLVFKGVPKRYVTQLAFIISTIALFLFGPSPIMRLPK